LFGLTPAETRVMLSLFEGFTPQKTAEHLDISFHTVQAHRGASSKKPAPTGRPNWCA
jgi:DNA-binding CsgD family transcriptional regulator